jgi:hypothetical protein
MAIGGNALTGSRVDDKLIDDHLAVQAIIRSYQVTITRASALLLLQGNHAGPFKVIRDMRAV